MQLHQQNIVYGAKGHCIFPHSYNNLSATSQTLNHEFPILMLVTTYLPNSRTVIICMHGDAATILVKHSY